MATAWILERRVEGGVRYEVRFREAGRSAPQKYAGRFKTRDEAERRRHAIELRLAASDDGQTDDLRLPEGWEPSIAIVGYVYAIGANGRRVKIGWSEDPLKRFRRLNTESSVPLRLLCVDAAIDRDLEYDLHRAFAEHRNRGEWFSLPEGWQMTWAVVVLDHHARGVRARVLGRPEAIGSEVAE